LRKSADYSSNYIEVNQSKSKIEVYMVRPYTYEFLRALEPFFELIVFSNMRKKDLEQLVTAIENILN